MKFAHSLLQLRQREFQNKQLSQQIQKMEVSSQYQLYNIKIYHLSMKISQPQWSQQIHNHIAATADETVLFSYRRSEPLRRKAEDN